MFHRVLQILLVSCIVALGVYIFWRLWPTGPAENEVAVADIEEQTTLVTLPLGKLESAGIKVEAARETTLQPTRTIAGRLDYDQDRHVASNRHVTGS